MNEHKTQAYVLAGMLDELAEKDPENKKILEEAAKMIVRYGDVLALIERSFSNGVD